VINHPPPELAGLHHLKFPVSDLDASLAFYESALGARRIPAFDHRREDGTVYAVILDVPGLGTYLELLLNRDAAAAQAGFDPVTLAVRTRGDLDRWASHLDQRGIEHSPILIGLLGWLLVFDDPDGRRLRFYTLEVHGPELAPSQDRRWLDPTG
jgi:catechol 2,3-dioxygenase-like lactoylglutathione lyase family enzyme